MKKSKLCYFLGLAIVMLILLAPTETKAYINYFKTTKYKITEAADKILSGLNVNDLKAQSILSNVSNAYNDENYGVKAYNALGEEQTGSKRMGTGSTLRCLNLKYNYSIDSITLVVYGDTSGDGQITASDALAIIKNKTGKVKFKDEYFLEAGRITETTRKNNAVPSAADALAIIKYKLGKAQINQYRQMQITVSSYQDLYTQLEQCNTNLKFDTTVSNYKEIQNNYKKLQEVVSKYCKSSMSQTTKALVLHDYLVTGSKLHYNVESCKPTDSESNIGNMGKTMNQLGFANTYTCLLGIAGIPSKVRRDRYANDPDGAVNEVTIDGQIYYVACGADSYISQVEGKGEIRRYFFLRNTEQLERSFWETEAYFKYTPYTPEKSTSTKYYGVRWPKYRAALDYKDSEIKLSSGKTIVRTSSELKDALLKGKKYIVDVIDADTQSVYELDEYCKKVIAKYIKPEMTQAQKALEIHDFICANFMRNDHEAYGQRNNSISNADYDRAWGYYKTSLLSGMGDCISASSSFNTLCAYVGIETQMVNEHQIPNKFGAGNHHWSLVKIDGEWYHCDPEGGDYYAYGEVSRTWFLCSDKGMRIETNTVQPCTSTKYDGYQWPEFKGIKYYQDKKGIIDENVPATSFWIKERASGVVGDTFNLQLRAFPYGTKDQATYSSSNPKIATVDANGTVKVLTTGTTTITVKVNNLTKSFTLKAHHVPKRINIPDMTLKVGETKKATYTVEPADAVYENGTWSTSNTNIATVDKNGNVTAVAAGTTYIYFNYEYNTSTTHVYSGNYAKITVTK